MKIKFVFLWDIYPLNNLYSQIIIIQFGKQFKKPTYNNPMFEISKSEFLSLSPSPWSPITLLLPTLSTQQLGQKLSKKYHRSIGQVRQITSMTKVYPGPNGNFILVRFQGLQAPDETRYMWVGVGVLYGQRAEWVGDWVATTGDVAVHPNRIQLVIYIDNTFNFYRLYKDKSTSLSYSLIATSSFTLPTQTKVSNLEYSACGNYLYSIQKTSTSLYPLKFNIATNQTTQGKNIYSIFMDGRKANYLLDKWGIIVNRNNGTEVYIGGIAGQGCLWDVQKMTVEMYRMQSPNMTKVEYTPVYIPTYNQTNSLSKNIFFAPISRTQYNQVLQSQNTQNNLTVFQNDKSAVKCIHLQDIDGYACARQGINNIYVTKYNEKTNTINPIAIIQSLWPQNSTNNFQFFYNSTSSELCTLNLNDLHCHTISSPCSSSFQPSPVFQCNSACSSSQSWSPVSLQCSPSKPSCSISTPMPNCQLSCSQIPQAIPQSYFNNTACICTPPFTWFPQLYQCRANCSTIQHADHQINYTKLVSKINVNQCVCKMGYRWRVKLDAFDQVGECFPICPTGQDGLCQCEAGKEWDPVKNECKWVKEKRGIPPWAIAIIVLSAILLSILLGWLIWKCWLKKKSSLPIQQSPTSRRSKPTRRSTDEQQQQYKQSSNQLKNIKICSVCHSQQPINCVGPCGHYYHFFCIKSRIDQGDKDCPLCEKTMENGISDLQYVQQKQEIITISDN